MIDETKDALLIASTVSGHDSNSRMHIPKRWIVKRKELKVETTKRKGKGKKPTEVGSGQNPPEIPYANF